MLELSEAIRDYHDHTGLPQMVCFASAIYVFCFMAVNYLSISIYIFIINDEYIGLCVLL